MANTRPSSGVTSLTASAKIGDIYDFAVMAYEVRSLSSSTRSVRLNGAGSHRLPPILRADRNCGDVLNVEG